MGDNTIVKSTVHKLLLVLLLPYLILPRGDLYAQENGNRDEEPILEELYSAETTEAAGDGENFKYVPPDRSSSGGLSASLDSTVNKFNGSFEAAVPVSVPPGRQGMNPSVNISYSSMASGGNAGFGWTVSMPSITRTGIRKGTPRYDGTDEFYLNAGGAVRLVAVGDPACPAGEDYCTREYRTRIESFSKVIMYYSASDPGAVLYWRVRGKDGSVRRFGFDEGSEVSNCEWYLDRAEDGNKNYMTYEYQPGDYSLNTLYPSRISYTGNSAAGHTPRRSVVFELDRRPDREVSYRRSLRQEYGDRISGIKVLGAGDSPLFDYRLEYESSPANGRSLLSRITQTGADGTQTYPPVEFGYRRSEPGWEGDAGIGIPGRPFARRYFKQTDIVPQWNFIADDGARMADVNGDGLLDKIDSFSRRDFEFYDQSECKYIEKDVRIKHVFLGTENGWSGDTGWNIPGLPFSRTKDRIYDPGDQDDGHACEIVSVHPLMSD